MALGPVPPVNEQSQLKQNVALQQLFGAVNSLNTTVASLNTTVANLSYGKFSVDLNGVNQSGTGGTIGKILFTHEAFDTSNVFSTITSQYVPQQAGYYFINLMAASHTSGNDCVQAFIRKNGTLTSEGDFIGTTLASDTFSTVHDLVHLNGTTDFIEGYVYLPVGTTGLYGAVTRTKMFGWQISS